MKATKIGALCAITYVAALVLSSCQRAPRPPAADGYVFGTKEFVHTTPTITFIVHPTEAALRAAAPLSAQQDAEGRGDTIMAWSVLRGADHNTCEVHIIDPAVRYAPEWIGHEITHCIFGRWH